MKGTFEWSLIGHDLRAAKEYMVNAISVGIRPLAMKLGEDVDLEASYKVNYF